jgi:hypothetical protein
MMVVVLPHLGLCFQQSFSLNDHTFDRQTLFLFSTNSYYLDETSELRLKLMDQHHLSYTFYLGLEAKLALP